MYTQEVHNIRVRGEPTSGATLGCPPHKPTCSLYTKHLPRTVVGPAEVVTHSLDNSIDSDKLTGDFVEEPYQYESDPEEYLVSLRQIAVYDPDL